MTTQEFEQEIKNIDAGFSIVENPNRPGLANIFYRGQNYDLPVVSSYEIKDDPDPSYTYEFPNGFVSRMWARSEIIPRLTDFLKNLNEHKYDDIYESSN